MTLIAYEGDDSWIEDKLLDAKKCLDDEKIPAVGEDCDYCTYRKAVRDVLEEHKGSKE